MSNRPLIVHEQIKSPVAEAYRTLRTNLQFAKADTNLGLIMYTSTGPGEGKSTTAANTAVALAQTGKKVLMIDCDFRKPVQHKVFELRNRGLTNFLVEGIPLEELIQPTGVPGVSVLTSGPIPPNPSELLGSKKMEQLLNAVRTKFDMVIVDAPPVIAVTDACVLAVKVDGIVLVISSGMTRPEMAQRAKELLLSARGTLLGAVLNRVKIDSGHAYYYYYYGDGERRKKRKEA